MVLVLFFLLACNCGAVTNCKIVRERIIIQILVTIAFLTLGGKIGLVWADQMGVPLIFGFCPIFVGRYIAGKAKI